MLVRSTGQRGPIFISRILSNFKHYNLANSSEVSSLLFRGVNRWSRDLSLYSPVLLCHLLDTHPSDPGGNIACDSPTSATRLGQLSLNQYSPGTSEEWGLVSPRPEEISDMAETVGELVPSRISASSISSLGFFNGSRSRLLVVMIGCNECLA